MQLSEHTRGLLFIKTPTMVHLDLINVSVASICWHVSVMTVHYVHQLTYSRVKKFLPPSWLGPAKEMQREAVQWNASHAHDRYLLLFNFNLDTLWLHP